MSRQNFTNVLNGPESIAAMQQVRFERDLKSQWPFPWCFPPPGAIRVTAGTDSSGTIAVPALATPTQGLLYTVDEGFQFALERIVVEYISNGIKGASDPGAFTWSLTLNTPVSVASFQGSPIQGFTNVDVPLGSLQIPWPLAEAELFQPNDAIRSVFTNVSLTPGSPNFFKTLFLGWKWPA